MHFLRLTVVALASLLLLTAARADDEDEFREAQRKLRTQLLSKEPATRIEALEELRKFPLVGAAQLIVRTALDDNSAEVQAVANQTLLELSQDETVNQFLFKTLQKNFRHKEKQRANETLLMVLLASAVPETREQLEQWLDQTIDPAFLQRITQRADPTAVELFRELSETEVFTNRFAFRRAVILALTQLDQPEAVDALVELLAVIEGEERVDIVVYLRSISGEATGIDVETWQAWWKYHRDEFEFPPFNQRVRDIDNMTVVAEDGSYSRYYGMSIYAKKVVFVIDASTSMEGVRLAAAKRELLQAIQELPADTEFAVVAYNSRAWAWQQQLQPANASAKRDAAAFVLALQPEGKTASFDALAAAFGYDTEAMYFLSDGVPTTGRITNPNAILKAIEELNRGRYVSIYTIGIQAGAEGAGFASFLEQLAAQNAGKFHTVSR